MKGRVARYQADRTNQKLYFTRIYCQLAETTEEAQLKLAHTESAIGHLYGAYLAFLQEIANFYGIKDHLPSLESIENALELRTQISPEIQRLKKAQCEDFLAEIEKAWQQVLYKPIPKLAEREASKQAKLPVIDVMVQLQVDNPISSDIVRQWRIELLDLIDSLREGMIEF